MLEPQKTQSFLMARRRFVISTGAGTLMETLMVQESRGGSLRLALEDFALLDGSKNPALHEAGRTR
jgi:hypothetical protein